MKMSNLINEQFGKDILSRNPNKVSLIDGIGYAYFCDKSDENNPFIENKYSFDQNFYKGKFVFNSPLTGKRIKQPPEIYGRHRLVAALLDSLTNSEKVFILDIGCGDLNIARLIPKDKFKRVNIINLDISGPWSSQGSESAISRGSRKLLASGSLNKEAIFNIQHDLNKDEWVFNDNVFDFIVSSMALHHVRENLKQKVFQNIFNSLQKDGSFILVDVFNKNKDGLYFTKSGRKGPSECKGYPINIFKFLSFLRESGFALDRNSQKIIERNSGHQTKEEFIQGLKEIHSTFAISESVWFIEAKK